MVSRKWTNHHTSSCSHLAYAEGTTSDIAMAECLPCDYRCMFICAQQQISNIDPTQPCWLTAAMLALESPVLESANSVHGWTLNCGFSDICCFSELSLWSFPHYCCFHEGKLVDWTSKRDMPIGVFVGTSFFLLHVLRLKRMLYYGEWGKKVPNQWFKSEKWRLLPNRN